MKDELQKLAKLLNAEEFEKRAFLGVGGKMIANGLRNAFSTFKNTRLGNLLSGNEARLGLRAMRQSYGMPERQQLFNRGMQAFLSGAAKTGLAYGAGATGLYGAHRLWNSAHTPQGLPYQYYR